MSEEGEVNVVSTPQPFASSDVEARTDAESHAHVGQRVSVARRATRRCPGGCAHFDQQCGGCRAHFEVPPRGVGLKSACAAPPFIQGNVRRERTTVVAAAGCQKGVPPRLRKQGQNPDSVHPDLVHACGTGQAADASCARGRARRTYLHLSRAITVKDGEVALSDGDRGKPAAFGGDGAVDSGAAKRRSLKVVHFFRWYRSQNSINTLLSSNPCEHGECRCDTGDLTTLARSGQYRALQQGGHDVRGARV